jgi:vancomycin resistance protein YoaR
MALGGALLIIVPLISTTVAFRAKVGGTSLALRSDKAIQNSLGSRIQTYEKTPITLSAGTTNIQLDPAAIGLKFDINESIKEARASLAQESLGDKLRRVLFGESLPLRFSYDRDLLISLADGWANELNLPVSDAKMEISHGQVVVVPGEKGRRLSFPGSVANLDEAVSGLKSTTVLPINTIVPLVQAGDLLPLKPRLEQWTSAPVNLSLEDGSYQATLSVNEIASLISVRSDAAGEALKRFSLELNSYVLQQLIPDPSGRAELKSAVGPSLDSVALGEYVDKISTHIDRSPVNAQLSANPGPAQVDSADVPGRTVNRTLFLARLQQVLNENGKRIVVIPTKATPAEVRADNLAELGITQLVSEGTSNYGNSPANRIFNIKNGVSKFASVLVKPGEVFSFNDTLGPVDASTGYLPELVILVNKTVPQFGGGLCQVSSTAWRGALNLGVPIVARTNHSYPVSYYFPIGTDATIYLPDPDMQWKNTTGHYILIQARVVGSQVYFDYYGTPTGWNVQFSRNEDLSGAVGRAEDLPNYVFNAKPDGSEDTVFYRKVTDATGGTVLTDHYFSHYDSPSKFPHTTTN